MKVLLIDDEPKFLEQAKIFLNKLFEDWMIETTESTEKCLNLIMNKEYDCIVSDYKMPEMNGLELLRNIRERNRKIPFIIITGKGDERVAMSSANLGVDRYIKKKEEPKKFFKKLSKSIREVTVETENDYIVGWIGKEAPLRRFVTKRLIGIEKDESVQKATQRMVNLGLSSLVVIDDNEIVGFFTDNDLKRKVIAKGLKPDIPVKDIMETDLITIDINTDVGSAVEKMAKRDIKYLLTEDERKINGILSFSDIIGMERHELDTYISRE